MKQFDLSTGEAALLREVLSNYLGDLRMEVRATDSYDYRQELKEKEDVLKELLARLARAA